MNRDDRENVTSLVRSVYSPSNNDRRVKARFWTAWNDGVSKGDPTFEDYVRVTGEKSLEKKSSDGSFVAWALNKREAMETLNYLLHLSLDKAEEIITSDTERTSDVIKVMGMVVDMVKATAPKTDTRLADEEINKMTPEQLDAFIIKKSEGVKKSGSK